MQAFYAEMHRIVGELMYAGNFYIALYDEERQAINWPFHVDELDEDWPDPNVWEPMGTGQARGITGYLIQAGQPMLLSDDDWRRMAARGEIVMVGEESVTWLGVPLPVRRQDPRRRRRAELPGGDGRTPRRTRSS